MTYYNMNYHAQATSESNAQLVTNRGRLPVTFENAYVHPSSVASCNVSEITAGVQCSEQIPSASATLSANFQMGAPGSPLRTSLASHNQQRQGAPSSGGDHMKVEKNRLDSFIGWPRNAHVRASDLAADGFYFIGVDDIVRCAFCHGTLKQWTPGDVVSIEHEKYFPLCPFVCRQDVGNVPLPPPALLSPLQSFPIEWTQRYFPQQQGPVCPDYSDISRRRQSFVGHPLPVGQTAQEFAEAGFFYIGPEDNVKCFYCGGSLKTWQSSDKPWSEHMRWFPHCIFVRDMQFQQLRISDDNHNASFGGSSSTVQRSPTHSAGSIRSSVHVTDTHNVRPSIPPLPVFVEAASESGSMSMETSELSELSSVSSTVTAGGGGAGLELLQEENRRLKDSVTCKICMDRGINTLFLPCGHLVSCDVCAAAVQQCPICRVEIRGSIRTYIS